MKHWDWVRSHLTSLALALLLALTVWIVASLEENPPEENDLPEPVQVDVVGLAPELVITNDYTDTTRVRLRAPREAWRSLSADDVVVTADLTGLGPGTYQVALDFQINPSTQAFLAAANPDDIRIVLEERGEREMPVQLTLDGQPAIGYSSGEAIISPRIVTVQGPRSRVDLISEVRATVSIEGQRDTYRSDVPLVARDSDGARVEGVTIVPSNANITVPVQQEAGFRNLTILVQTVGRPGPGYYMTGITTTPQTVTVQGDPTSIEAMQPYVETQTIDLTNLTDDLIVDVTLELPPGVLLVGEQTVTVLISIAAQISSRTVLDIPVEPTGLGEDLTVALSPATIDVILTGPIVVLDSLDPQQSLRVTIDLTDRGPGVYQIEPQVSVLVEDVLVESVLPLVIQAQVTPSQGP
jgi:YbbR domain-containing protein